MGPWGWGLAAESALGVLAGVTGVGETKDRNRCLHKFG